MKTTLYMAVSANGMIARKNGEEDFLSHQNWEKFESLAKQYGNFVVGRKTYDVVMGWDEQYNFDTVTGVEKVVVSQDTSKALGEGYTVVDSPQGAIDTLVQRGLEDVLVIGGATLNSAFVKVGLLDEIILSVEPVFIGEGVPLFSEEGFDLGARLIAAEEDSGLLTLRYQIVK